MTKKDEDIRLGEKIREIRLSLNYDQKTFAHAIGATVSALSNWENGRNKPNQKKLNNIAILGNTSVESLLNFSGWGWDKTYSYIMDILKNPNTSDSDSELIKLNLLLLEGVNGMSLDAVCERATDFFISKKLNYDTYIDDHYYIISNFLHQLSLFDYTPDGAIRFALKKVFDLYSSDLLDYFIDNNKPRENMPNELYSKITAILHDTENRLNSLLVAMGKERYTP